MSFFMLKRTKLNDEQYVERTRKHVNWLDRNRFWIILFQMSIIALICWTCTKAMQVLLGLGAGQNVPVVVLGFIIGAMTGLTFGWMIGGIIHSTASFIFGLRTERLLLKYYDRLYCADENMPE